ncbi:MAG: hypothetical protein LBL32_01190 [Holosporales bacterium]|jgi:hypothetical protein|nr:hypothetical protein [Holosporales bacterium]
MMKKRLGKAFLAYALEILSCWAGTSMDVEYLINHGLINERLVLRGEEPSEHLLSSCTYTDGRTLRIPNGSAINFAARDAVGRIIRIASSVNTIPNPLYLTHSGLVINDDPRIIYGILEELIEESTLNGCQPRIAALRLMMLNLSSAYDHILGFQEEVGSDNLYVVPFCLEASGTASQVMGGIMPHVQIRAMHQVVNGYNGNVFVRPLLEGIPAVSTRKFLKEYLGRSYEGIWTILELLRAPIAHNKREETDRVFCSEMVALFYKTYSELSIDNVSNVIPEILGAGAEEHDLLKDIASTDIPLKMLYDFSEEDNCCCCTFSNSMKKCLIL